MGYIRKEIVIDFHVPKVLKNLFIDAEEADERNDGSYDDYAEAIDNVSKYMVTEGVLTRKQWDTIIDKYPYPYW